MFLSDAYLSGCGWQGFERAVQRLLIHLQYTGVRLVGQSGDLGADVLGHKFGKRWLFQIKYWKRRVPERTIDETLRASAVYRAEVPVVVALAGFDAAATHRQQLLQQRGVPLQLWDSAGLRERLGTVPPGITWSHGFRPYQEQAITEIVSSRLRGDDRGLAVLATGLGKTVIAAEAVRRIRKIEPRTRTLVLAHTNSLVYQLERAFWSFIEPTVQTAVWNGFEKPTREELEAADFIFATVQTLYEHTSRLGELPSVDVVIVDECHHAMSDTYGAVLDDLTKHGSKTYLLGLTATPWRGDQRTLTDRFGDPTTKVDIVDGMRGGYLTNVDYRMYTDNIKWDAIRDLSSDRLTPKSINRTFFITEWDDAVVRELRAAWLDQHKPRAIVFCGTIDHAITMRDRINQSGFARAGAIYSSVAGRNQSAPERARLLADFHDGAIGVLCTVDMLNEGIDVPDVNIVVFQRVTHSRRIFVQQLGRGLRLAPDKDRVLVLDFVSDIRRFAAGLALKDQLGSRPANVDPLRVSINHTVTFRRVGGEDEKAERFLRTWLEDVAAVEDAGEDSAVLKFPPRLEE